MFLGVEHTAIASPDPERLAAWYVDKLGFTINYRYGGNVFVKAPDGAMLEIIPAEGERPPQTLKTPGLRHLAIRVADFDAALRRLKEIGVELLGDPVEIEGNRLAFFTDADGNYLHIVHRARPLP
ncbi:MAG: VOC family protein [Bryobacteraceae bacterium]